MLFCLIFFIFSKKIVMFIGRNIVKHGKNFTLGEYVIIKKPELVEIGDNVRISDFCRISSACVIGSDCEIAPGTYIYLVVMGNFLLRWGNALVYPLGLEFGLVVMIM